MLSEKQRRKIKRAKEMGVNPTDIATSSSEEEEDPAQAARRAASPKKSARKVANTTLADKFSALPLHANRFKMMLEKRATNAERNKREWEEKQEEARLREKRIQDMKEAQARVAAAAGVTTPSGGASAMNSARLGSSHSNRSFGDAGGGSRRLSSGDAGDGSVDPLDPDDRVGPSHGTAGAGHSGQTPPRGAATPVRAAGGAASPVPVGKLALVAVATPTAPVVIEKIPKSKKPPPAQCPVVPCQKDQVRGAAAFELRCGVCDVSFLRRVW